LLTILLIYLRAGTETPVLPVQTVPHPTAWLGSGRPQGSGAGQGPHEVKRAHAANGPQQTADTHHTSQSADRSSSASLTDGEIFQRNQTVFYARWRDFSAKSDCFSTLKPRNA
jgi:hypothetical protein